MASEPPAPAEAAEPAPPLPVHLPFQATQAWMLFLAYVGVQFGTGIAIGVLVAIGYGVTGGLRAPGATAEAMRTATILGGLFGMVAGGWVVYRLVRKRHRLQPFGWVPSASRPVLLAALAGVAIAAVFLAILFAFPPPSGARAGLLGRSIAGGGWPLYVWAFLAIVVAPPVEEFVFRGVIWTGLARSLHPVAAALTVTALFVAMHVTEAWGNAPALIAITAMGLATLAARIATRSLIPPIALHAAYNAVLALTVIFSRP